MSKITLPPPAMHAFFITTECVDADDKLELEIDFDGYIAISVTGLFSPDLPTGPVSKGITYHTPLVKKADLVLGYFDDSHDQLFLLEINIREECPKLPGHLSN